MRYANRQPRAAEVEEECQRRTEERNRPTPARVLNSALQPILCIEEPSERHLYATETKQ